MRGLILVLLLSGCAQTLANLNGRLTPEQEQQLFARWAGQCESLGYRRDTDPWRDCILKQRDYALARQRAVGEAAARDQPRSCYRDVLGATCY